MCAAEQMISRFAPKGQRSRRFGRPVVAVSTHTHHTDVCCRIRQFRAAPNIQGLQGLRRPGAAASKHMCVAEIRVAPGIRNFIKPSPTTGCCEHTHVCCRLSHLRVAPKDQGLQGFARPIAAATIHMCAAK